MQSESPAIVAPMLPVSKEGAPESIMNDDEPQLHPPPSEHCDSSGNGSTSRARELLNQLKKQRQTFESKNWKPEVLSPHQLQESLAARREKFQKHLHDDTSKTTQSTLDETVSSGRSTTNDDAAADLLNRSFDFESSPLKTTNSSGSAASVLSPLSVASVERGNCLVREAPNFHNVLVGTEDDKSIQLQFEGKKLVFTKEADKKVVQQPALSSAVVARPSCAGSSTKKKKLSRDRRRRDGTIRKTRSDDGSQTPRRRPRKISHSQSYDATEGNKPQSNPVRMERNVHQRRPTTQRRLDRAARKSRKQFTHAIQQTRSYDGGVNNDNNEVDRPRLSQSFDGGDARKQPLSRNRQSMERKPTKLLQLTDVELPQDLVVSNPRPERQKEKASTVNFKETYYKKAKPVTPVLGPKSGKPRHERNAINKVMVRGRAGMLADKKPAVTTDHECMTEEPQPRPSQQSLEQLPKTYGEKTVRSTTHTLETRRSETDHIIDRNESPNVASWQTLSHLPWEDDCKEKSADLPPAIQKMDLSGSIYDVSIADPSAERRALLEFLQEDLKKGPQKKKIFIPKAPGSPTVSESSEFDLSDDSSSVDFTTSSDTSGFAASLTESTLFLCSDSPDETHSVVSGMSLPNLAPDPSLKEETNGDNEFPEDASVPSALQVFNSVQISSLSNHSTTESNAVEDELHCNDYQKDRSENGDKTFEKPLFASTDITDELCKAHGGLYYIAAYGGALDLSRRRKVSFARMNVKPFKPPTVCLSTDFRCGTFGSLYDISVRSGCKMHGTSPHRYKQRSIVPPSVKARAKKKAISVRVQETSRVQDNTSNDTKPKKKFYAARGGLFDMAVRSGLTKERLLGRAPISVTTKHSMFTLPTLIPEIISDGRCGASGTLKLLEGCAGVTSSTSVDRKSWESSLYAIEEAEREEAPR